MYSGQVFPLTHRLASVKTSASEQQNTLTGYSNYKSHNNYYYTTNPIILLCLSWAYWLRARIGSAKSGICLVDVVCLQNELDWPTSQTTNHWNEVSTKVTYSVSEMAWITNTLEYFFAVKLFGPPDAICANSKTGEVWKNAWNSEKFNSNGGHKYPQCIANMFQKYPPESASGIYQTRLLIYTTGYGRLEV